MSQDYGLKISLPGFDVKTATPEECSIHSSYDSLKVKLDPNNPQEGNILVTFQDNPALGTYPIYTIHHGYGYIPAFYLFFDIQGSNANTGTETGSIFPLNAMYDAWIQAVPDTQNIVISFVTDGNTLISGNYYAFKYYVFANDGI